MQKMNHRERGYRSHHRRRGGRWSGGGGARKTTMHATLAPPLGEIIATIQHDDIEDSVIQEDPEARITNSQYLTSYNWLARENHLIIVPGEKISLMDTDRRDHKLIRPYKVNRPHGHLSLSRFSYEKTPVNTIVTLMLDDIRSTHLSP